MKNKKINRNVNKMITLTMAGAVALSTPLSLVYAAPDASETHDYVDMHGTCDICGESKEDGNHFIDEIIEDDEIIVEDTESTETTENTETIVDAETSESTETESTETTEEPEEKNLKDFTFFIKGYNTASDEEIATIYNKLKTDGRYVLNYDDNKTERGLGLKVSIYNNDGEIIDTLTIYNGDEIIKNLPDKDEHGYKQFSYKSELVAENLHYTKDGDCFMYSSIKIEDGEIPVLKFFRFFNCDSCKDSESPIHIESEYGVVCDYNDPDFDLDTFLQDEEIHKFFYPEIVYPKGCICDNGIPDLPPLPDLPDTETSETTESTEIPSTETSEEKPSTETSEEKPSTETSEEKPSTETSEEKPSTETSEEKPSTETSEEKPSTETSEEKPSTETSEEKPSTETSEEKPSTETSEEKPSTETSEEKPSTETSEEKPSTETTTTPTPEPVKPVEPDKTEETTTTITPTPEPNKTEETITPTPEPLTEDRGKVDPDEVKNEMVQTGDFGTSTYYGGYFLATAFGVLTAFFKKFKK